MTGCVRYAPAVYLPAMLSPRQIRAAFASHLIVARGERSRLSSIASGVPYNTISALEAERRENLEFRYVYLLAAYYEIDLAAMIDFHTPLDTTRRWPRRAPSMPDTEAHVCAALRNARRERGIGTPALASDTGIEQSWIVRLELGNTRFDVLRATRLAEALDVQLSKLLPKPFGVKRRCTS